MIYRISIIAISACLAITACSTTVSEGSIPSDATAKQVLQKGLDKLSNEEFDLARSYFGILINKFANDRDTVIEAKYNIAVSYVREKDLSKAKAYLADFLKELNADSPTDKQFAFLCQQLLLQTEPPATPSPSPSSIPVASPQPSPSPKS